MSSVTVLLNCIIYDCKLTAVFVNVGLKLLLLSVPRNTKLQHGHFSFICIDFIPASRTFNLIHINFCPEGRHHKVLYYTHNSGHIEKWVTLRILCIADKSNFCNFITTHIYVIYVCAVSPPKEFRIVFLD